jgi:hypothetical protein
MTAMIRMLKTIAPQSSCRSSRNSVILPLLALATVSEPIFTSAMMSSSGSDFDEIVADQQHHDQREHILGDTDDQPDLERSATGLAEFLEVDVAPHADQTDAKDPLHPVADHLDRRGGRRPAFDAGINFFDNAEVYARGQSEPLMGQALKTLAWPRLNYLVSTKFFWGLDRDGEAVNRRATLNRLANDYGAEAAETALRATRAALDDLDRNVNARLAVEVMLLDYPGLKRDG